MLDADAEEHIDEAQWLGYIVDLQAAYLLYIAGIVYRRGIMEQAGTTAYCQYIFRLSSTDWYRFLGFVSADNSSETSPNSHKRKCALWKEKIDNSQIIQQY